MEKDLDVINKMQVYSSAIKFINTNLSKRKEHYEHYLLVLDNVSKTITVTSFEKWKLDNATDLYLQKEKMFLGEVTSDLWAELQQMGTDLHTQALLSHLN